MLKDTFSQEVFVRTADALISVNVFNMHPATMKFGEVVSRGYS